MRKDYDTSLLFDDVSDQFDGVTSEFTLNSNGSSVTGIGSTGGNGVVFIGDSGADLAIHDFRSLKASMARCLDVLRSTMGAVYPCGIDPLQGACRFLTGIVNNSGIQWLM